MKNFEFISLFKRNHRGYSAYKIMNFLFTFIFTNFLLFSNMLLAHAFQLLFYKGKIVVTNL